MTTVYPRPDTSRPLVPSDFQPPVPDPVDTAFHAMDDWAKPLAQPAAVVRANRKQLMQVIDGLPSSPRDGDAVAELSYLGPTAFDAVIDLFRRARAHVDDGQPRYTPPMLLTAGAVEAIYTTSANTHVQVLHAKNERTWHDLLAAPDCEEEGHSHCVVLLSDAWADGGAHLPIGEELPVRVRAEVTA